MIKVLRFLTLTALSVFAAFLLSSCLKPVNLQDRAIVQGIGIDWQDGEFLVTMQVFSSDGSGGQTMIDPSQQNAKIISCKGKSIAEAVAETTLSQGRTFFLGHNRLLILGKGVFDKSLGDTLSYFANSTDFREDVAVLATEQTAAEILGTNINQGILPAMTIEKTVENAAAGGFCGEVRVIDVLRALAEPHRSILLPLIRAEKDDSEKQLRTIQLDNMGAFNRDGYLGKLNREQVQGYLLLQNQLDTLVTHPDKGGKNNLSVKLYQNKTKIVPVIKEDSISFTVKMNAQGLPVEGDLTDKAAAEAAIAEMLESACQAAFEKVGREYQSDVFGFGDLVWKDQPELWRVLREDWKEVATTIQLNFETTVQIDT